MNGTKKLSPFKKGSCSPPLNSGVEGFMNSMSFQLSELSESTETNKFFPRGKLGPRPVVLRGGVVGGCS